MTNTLKTCYRRQRGLGIIEVLVALVVVSFGVLGMASLQLTGMKHSTGGYNRSQALMFAENMATRMRINTAAITSSAYAGFDSSTVNCAAKPAAYCQADPGGGAIASCSAAELATFDMFSVACGDWGTAGAEDGISGALPTGGLTIVCADAPCTPTSTYTINVNWAEGKVTSTMSDDPVTRRVQVRLRP